MVKESALGRWTRRSFLTGSLAAGGVLAGCAAPADGVVLRYATPYASGHPYSRADAAWIAEVARLSGGGLAFEAYWGGSLIRESETLRELRSGVADASYILPIYTRAGTQLIRGHAAFYQGTTTILEQEAVFHRLLAEFPELRAELPGLRMLLATGGPRLQIMTQARPVTRLRDLGGLRLRAPAEVTTVLERLGVDAEFMPMGEVYTAISRGTIDGIVAPLDTLRAMRFAEVVRYCTLFEISRGVYPSRAINERRLACLDEPLQAAILGAVPVWAAASRDHIERATEAGIAFGREQHVQFLDLPAEEHARFAEIYADAALEQARRLDAAGLPGSAMLARAQQIIAARDFGA